MPDATDANGEATRKRVEAFEAIVSDVIEGRVPLSEFAKRLQDAGASPGEGEDYLHQLTQRLEQQKKDREKDNQRDTECKEDSINWTLLVLIVDSRANPILGFAYILIHHHHLASYARRLTTNKPSCRLATTTTTTPAS